MEERRSHAVGARVEVLWEGALYAAVVTRCHTTGKYDVVYEKGETTGTFLTFEEHRLLPLKEGEKVEGAEVEVTDEEADMTDDDDDVEEKEVGRGDEEEEEGEPLVKQKKVWVNTTCLMEGCTKQAACRGVCILHGAYGMCLTGDCTAMALNKTQLCHKHGANGVCTVPGCATKAQARWLCRKHGGGSQARCVHPGCTTNAARRGLCTKHGGYGLCRAPDCPTNARPGRAGLCFKHSKFKICPEPDCTSKVQVRGWCKKHDNAFNPK
jgi:hypothetical protein